MTTIPTRDPLGLTNTHYHDALQRPIATHFPDGSYTSNLYSHLDLSGQRDRLGNWTTFAYNSVRQRTAITNALGKVTSFNYCICGALDSTTDALNNTTSFYYDKAGNQIATVYADGSWTTNQYNLWGQVTNQSDSSGQRLTNYYNAQGLLRAASNAFGRVQSMIYDAEDHPTNVVDSTETTVVPSHDSLHRIVARTYPDGGVERFAYSQLQWTLPAGVVAGDIAWPVPSKIPFGTLTNYGYGDTVLLPVPLTITPEFKPSSLTGDLEVKLKAQWLVCVKVCIPEEGEFTLRVSAKSTTAINGPAFDASFAAQPKPLQGESVVTPQARSLELRVSGLPASLQGKTLELFPETGDVIDNSAKPNQAWQGSPSGRPRCRYRHSEATAHR